jgi:hypothetical protein
LISSHLPHRRPPQIHGKRAIKVVNRGENDHPPGRGSLEGNDRACCAGHLGSARGGRERRTVERLNAVLRFLFAAIRIGESTAPAGRFDYGRIEIEQNKL